MRKIVVLTFVSLDGVMQAPGGPEEDKSGGFEYGGWTAPYFDEFAGKVMGEQISSKYDLLLGANTYEIFAAYWPKQSSNNPVTDPFNKATKYLVTDRKMDPSWDKTVVIEGDVPAKLKQLKQGDGPALQVHGSGNLVQTLFKHDLVDELWLKTFPVTLGRGKRLWGDGTQPAAWKLLDSQVSPSGVIFASYKRDGEVKTGSMG